MAKLPSDPDLNAAAEQYVLRKLISAKETGNQEILSDIENGIERKDILIEKKKFLDSIYIELLQDIHEIGNDKKNNGQTRLRAKERLLDERTGKLPQQVKKDDDDTPSVMMLPQM